MYERRILWQLFCKKCKKNRVLFFLAKVLDLNPANLHLCAALTLYNRFNAKSLTVMQRRTDVTRRTPLEEKIERRFKIPLTYPILLLIKASPSNHTTFFRQIQSGVVFRIRIRIRRILSFWTSRIRSFHPTRKKIWEKPWFPTVWCRDFFITCNRIFVD